MRKTETRELKETAASMRWEYLMSACWAFYRADTEDENLLSALQRSKASAVRVRMDAFQVPVPAPEEVYEYAQTKWPAHRLHPLLVVGEVGNE